MIKRAFSLILAFGLILTLFSVGSFAESGQLTDELSWRYTEGDGLYISGSGTEIPDFEEGQAPWQQYSANIFKLSLPKQIESIGNYAFFNCANLKSVVLPENLKKIGDFAFRNSGLESLDLPYNLKSLGTEAFAGSEDLKSINFGTLHSGGMDVEIVDGLETVGDKAFEFCDSLERLSFPETLKTIGAGAFENCYSLKSVSFDDSGKKLETIGDEAFSYCTSLYSFTLPESISEIGYAVFRATALKSIKLHSGLSKVGNMAFFGCDELQRIDVLNENCSFYADEKTTPAGAKLYVTAKMKNAISFAEKFSKPYEVLCTGRIAHSSKSFKQTVTKASSSANGQIKKVCSSCGYTVTSKIAKIKTVKLTKTSFTYNSKVQSPTASQVQVLDENGKVIPSTYYTVSRVKTTDGRKVGKHAVKITFKGNFQGSNTRYYNIVPKGTAIKSVSAGKGTLKINWAKQSTQTTGYQIRLCKNNKFTSGVKVYTVKNYKTVTLNVKKLSRKTGYYIQIRTYKTVSGKHYFSGWSKSFGRKTK